MSPYAYNSSNQLTSTPAAAFTYDGNGNTLTKADLTGITQYAWDFENRLTSVVLPGTAGTVTFKYDPFGRRVKKSSSAGTTNYLYDGSNSVEEVDQSGVLLTRYAQGAGIDEPLAEARGGTAGFYEQDGLGSVTSLSGSSGALANTYAYDSFGVLTASTGTLGNPFQHTGRDYDSETGLRYYRARYYDPAIGRFISEDPIGFMAGGANFYRYVNNNPINFIDPRGLQTTVFIIYDTFFGIPIGSHSAVYVDNGGKPILYDAAGSYTNEKKCGSGNACEENNASPNKYKKYHESTGSTVKVFTFATTTAEEAKIAANILKVGGADPPYCTISVINVLQGVGPFKDLESTIFPGNLADALDAIINHRRMVDLNNPVVVRKPKR